MTFEWKEDNFVGFPAHQSSSDMLNVSVCEFPGPEYWWLAVACNSTPTNPNPRACHYETVSGCADTLDSAKAAAEQMGRRMRKVLRWAR